MASPSSSVDPGVGEQVNFFANLAGSLSTSEAALRLFISLLLAYPLSLFHRYSLFGKAPIVQHLYFAFCGLSLLYFNFGLELLHGILNILIVYLMLKLIPDNKLCVVSSFFFNLIYLVVLYYYTATKNYDIMWTTPHCVLTLRLTGLAFDVYDGSRKETDLSADQKETALKKVPSIFEVFGHMFFVGGAVVGPQFPMKRYLDFINGAFADKITHQELPRCVLPGVTRLGIGITYIAIYQVSAIYFPDDYLTASTFDDLYFWKKIVFIMIWTKITLYKYVACWLISEGSCIMSGISYNGKDENGNNLWDGCTNIKIWKFETAACGQDMIASFNLNTNLWMGKYVYKRLKFVGNRHVSQICTLFYLAIWHGLHSGYYNNFFLEYIIMNFEKDMIYIVSKVSWLSSIVHNTTLKPGLYVIKKFYQLFIIGYAIVSFALLKYAKYGKVYASIYYCGHIFFILWPLLSMIIRNRLTSKKRDLANGKEVDKTE